LKNVSTFKDLKTLHTMTFSKNSSPNASTPTVDEMLIQRQLQMRRQRELQEESRSSASNNEESDSLSSSRLRSFTAASEQLRMQRQLQQELRNPAPENEESDALSSAGLHSLTGAPRGSQSNSMTVAKLRSILNCALAVLDESDDEAEDGVESSRCGDSNSEP
jgi:hypothetical protein